MPTFERPDLIREFGRASKFTRGQLGGFRTFILRGNVVDMAIGIVIGAAFTAVVNGMVHDVFLPLIPAPGGSLVNWAPPVPWNKGATIQVGSFIDVIVSFLIVAAVLYFFVVLPINTLTRRFKPHAAEVVTTRDCPYCLQAIPLKATRCAFCTSPVESVEELVPAPASVQHRQ
jgi:large conductance mechanosensitive channel